MAISTGLKAACPAPSLHRSLCLVDLDDLISAYWEHYRLAHGVREDRLRADDLFWAWEAVEAVVRGETEQEFWFDSRLQKAVESVAQGYEGQQYAHRPLDVLVKLSDLAPTEEALGYLGAGPVEDYLVYGQPDLSGVEEAAKHNPRFRIALRCAWFDDKISPEDAARLRKLVPGP